MAHQVHVACGVRRYAARAAVRTAGTASLTDEAAAAYARASEDGGEAHPTAAGVAEDYRGLVKTLAGWWE